MHKYVKYKSEKIYKIFFLLYVKADEYNNLA